MQIILAALAIMMSPFASAASLGFDGDAIGSEPQGWLCGVTGSGVAVWRVETDPSAPSPPNILKQSGQGTFPWCVVRDASLADGFVEVKFKPLSGREDQAGGVIWRWKDGNNYYVARANALENNVSLYYVQRGRRITLKYVDAPVSPNVWHTLRVTFLDTRIQVTLDGTTRIEHTDNHIIGTGTIGVWTKADSITAFDDIAYGAPGANR